MQFPLEDYPWACPIFDCVGNFVDIASREFIPNKAIEDHWLNCQDDYEVQI